MFSKLRAGAKTKKAGGRQDRTGDRSQDSDPAQTKNRDNLIRPAATHGSQSSEALVAVGASASAVPSTAPTLPPIPRIASKASQHATNERIDASVPSVGVSAYHDGTADNLTGLSDHSASGSDGEPNSVTELDQRYKATSLSSGGRASTLLMPPPPRPSIRSVSSNSNGPRRSQTDFIQRPTSARTNASAASSKGSSMLEDIPSHHRLHEPEDYVTPSQAIRLGNQQQSRPKSRLTRLNPLSYLNRRKSSQPFADEIDENAIAKRASFIAPFQPLSQDFDPRIKGKVIHDFTSPKPSHFVSVQNLRSAAAQDAVELPPSGIYDVRRGSDSNLPRVPLGDTIPDKRHTPVFKEDFERSAEEWRLDPADRRNQRSSDIVDKVAALEKTAKDEKRKSNLPAFAVRMPQDIPEHGDVFSTPEAVRTGPAAKKEPDITLTPNSIQQTPDSLKPPKDGSRGGTWTPSPQESPLADRSSATSPDAPQTFSSLPRHLRSKTASVRSQASRFSFDMAGGGSAAQEQILEEKHRQRSAQLARANSLNSLSINEEDGYDEDEIDFDADMEDDIPGMNDDEDYSFRGAGVANMTLDSSNDLATDPQAFDEEEDDLDMSDLGGGGLGNMTLESFGNRNATLSPTSSRYKEPQGLGLQTEDLSMSRDLTRDSASTVNATSANNGPLAVDVAPSNVGRDVLEITNDGFYYDDGEFDAEFGDELEENAHQNGIADVFDETLLDRDFARGQLIESLRPIPNGEPATVSSSQPSTRPQSVDSEVLVGKRQSEVTADSSRTSMQLPQARRSSAYGMHSELEAKASLTQENLSAYHNALAYAANQAASQGRFQRESTGEEHETDDATRQPSVTFAGHSPVQDRAPGPGLVLDGTHDDGYNDADDFNFDDSLDDDAIIDAANAEALENDEEDEYGSEFGFYASTGGSEEAQAFHGGYFGPSLSQIKRSHSGREAFQEPSLTPITERSEWSNRNSMISLAMHGTGISPGGIGLAQLADQMQHEGAQGDDMTLSALMKARRGAFGSTTSLQSLGNVGGSRSGSPSLYAFQQQQQQQQQQNNSPLGGNGISPPPPLTEEVEEYDDMRAAASSLPNPMLTLQTQNLALRPTTSGSDSSPLKRTTPATYRAHGHSRTSSGADSVSYAMQRNEEGGEMWVVEKRRTLDNGEVEILDRDVVHGVL